MGSIDNRSYGVKAINWTGIFAACVPAALCLGALIQFSVPKGVPNAPFADVLLGLCLITAVVTCLAAFIAQMANPRFDLKRPDFIEFVKGILIAPVWVVSNALVFAITAFFIAGLTGLLLLGVRQL